MEAQGIPVRGSSSERDVSYVRIVVEVVVAGHDLDHLTVGVEGVRHGEVSIHEHVIVNHRAVYGDGPVVRSDADGNGQLHRGRVIAGMGVVVGGD